MKKYRTVGGREHYVREFVEAGKVVFAKVNLRKMRVFQALGRS
jgi:hypothetical protein